MRTTVRDPAPSARRGAVLREALVELTTSGAPASSTSSPTGVLP